jgi:lambda family phage portal protein
MAKAPLFDRVLSRLGLARRRSSQRTYSGAQVSRLTQDWFASTQSADMEIKADLRRLRGASRSLVRDNAYARRYVGLVAENVVGPYGIKLQANVGTTRNTPAAAFNEALESAWCCWGKARNASYDTRTSWTAMQQQILRTMPQDGEVFVRRIKGADNEFGYALQVIDADLVDHDYNVPAAKSLTGNSIIMGVELEARTRRPLAYWMWTEHPNDFLTQKATRVRIPADEMLHLFVQERPGQTRGVPWFAPVLFDQKMMGAYQEAEITAARVGASNVATITTKAEEMIGDANDVASAVPVELEPASVWRLNPGEELSNTNFAHPSTAFGPFMKEIKRSIATGLGVSYTALTGDLESVNYSSIRAGLLQERDVWRTLQEWITESLHEIVFPEWLAYASLMGKINPQQASAVDCETEIRWLPRGWAWIDPLKDMEAAAMAIREGFTTRTAVCAERGDDFAENVELLQQEKQMADDAGLVFGLGAMPTPSAALADPSQTAPARALRLARAQE